MSRSSLVNRRYARLLLLAGIPLTSCGPASEPPQDSAAEIPAGAEATASAARTAPAVTRTPEGLAATFGSFDVVFAGEGARLSAEGSAVSLRFSAWGRDGEMAHVQPVDATSGACVDTAATVCEPRVEYARDGVVEWWAPRPDALQQGWDLQAAPAGVGPVLLEVTVDVGQLKVVEQGEAVAIETSPDGSGWSYADLHVWDSNGVELPAFLETEGQVIRLVIDDSGAHWPLRVDPIVVPLDPIAPDADGDLSEACVGMATEGCDCNDANSLIKPSATEVAGNNVDENCDVVLLCYQDVDNDTYGSTTTATATAASSATCADAGESTLSTDCTDTSSAIKPGAAEVVGDGIDQDCSGADACYEDLDGDTYGTATLVANNDSDCTDTGESTRSNDCDDNATTGSTRNPGLTETAGNDLDENCDNSRLCYTDGDNDTFGSTITVATSSATCAAAGESTLSTDCADTSSAVKPGATETNGNDVDENCDGSRLCYQDSDNDLFGSTTTATTTSATCAAGSESTLSTDCDDGSSARKPGATETNGNDVDENCDGTLLCYNDGDSDNFGSTTTATTSSATCDIGGESTLSTDCNDGSSAIKPGATETAGNDIDENCDNSRLCYQDSDNDLFGSTTTATTSSATCAAGSESTLSTDCNDASSAVKPGATETVGNDVDENCDNSRLCYTDGDNDLFGTSVTTSTSSATCVIGGESTLSTDCDDGSSAIKPGATETAGNDIDENCDNSRLCYQDSDNDLFGSTATASTSSATCAAGSESTLSTDCNDASSAVKPGATETVGNDVDENCDNSRLCYTDADNDLFGTSVTTSTSSATCVIGGESTLSTDCNDASSAIKPTATETVGNDIDENCDDDRLCYQDSDNDTYGSSVTAVTSSLTCAAGSESTLSSDCNDASSAVKPGATETVGNDIDENCDNSRLCYQDVDNDLFGTSTTTSTSSATCVIGGESTLSTDCNDASSAIKPTATETIGNDVDENCDDSRLCYQDGDNDTYGSSVTTSTSSLTCLAGSESTLSTDCDDVSPSDYPGAAETVNNGDDEDCDGVDSCYTDADNDDYGTTVVRDSTDLDCNNSLMATRSDDCDDTSNTDYPGASETVNNGDDEDCDGFDHCYTDADDDNYGTSVSKASADLDCADGLEAPVSGDCDDASNTDYPGASETVNNGDDEDCDGVDSCYTDADDDNYGTTVVRDSTDLDCDNALMATISTDCDDTSNTDYPGAAETVNNGDDEDCDGVDSCYTDADDDNFGTSVVRDSTDLDCNNSLMATVSNDCDDASNLDYPGAPETVNNGDDEDCDGVDSCYQDLDDDNYGTSTVIDANDLDCLDTNEAINITDCDDLEKTSYPGASETCGDGVDSNCDLSGGGTSSDDDLDGVNWGKESSTGSNDCDTDSDDDTVADGTEYGSSSVAMDTDADGTKDILDTDDDGDGLTTKLEDPNGNGNPTDDDTDADGKKNYLDSDDDGDGILTSVEGTTADTDGDGTKNYLERDDDGDGINSDSEGTTLDTDGDGIKNYQDADDDGDGISTASEGTSLDTDGDGIKNYLERDDDGDGINTDVEGTSADTDGDSKRNYLDSDDDGDGVLTLTEGSTLDTDGDSTKDYLDTDDDGDGVLTATEGSALDTDVDGKKNYLDSDDDGDTIPTLTEGGTVDTDSDGKLNYLDTDSDGDTYLDATEGTTDTDSDGKGDYIDTDSDADLVLDSKEANLDTDSDGKSNRVDNDDDGDTLLTALEDTDGNGDATNDDADGDGIANFLETDSDADGYSDTVEGLGDTDADAKKDYVDTDSDADTVPDLYEANVDTDADGKSNRVDNDDDGDTILTKDEDVVVRNGSPTDDDTDGDGIVDFLDDDDDDDDVKTKYEEAEGTEYRVEDSDGDSISDGEEWGIRDNPTARDSDGDGVIDPLDDDDDNDGIYTIEEGKSDIDGDPDAGCAENPDGNGNHIDTDSDGDGKLDSEEGTGDADDDGVPNFLDCNDGDGCFGDSDFDGLANCDERDLLGTSPTDADSDDDGVDDYTETGGSTTAPPDTDGDDIIDALDRDDDGDNVLTEHEDRNDDGDPTNDDTDNDGISDYLDTDDDNDGIDTKDEDTNSNGNPRDDDDDSNGIPNYLDDGVLGPTGDIDGDGITNGDEDDIGSDKYSQDSDGDGVPDAMELGDVSDPTDTDQDGEYDIIDTDDDGDDIPTDDEGSADADADGKPNYLDTDSDGDGLSDGDEGVNDVDCDGLPEFLDTFDDSAGCDTDPETGETGTEEPPKCGCSGTPTAPVGGLWAGLIGLALLRRRRAA